MRKTSFLFIFLTVLCCRSKDEVVVKPVDKVYDVSGMFTHDGKLRTYRLHLPPSYYDSNNNLPLVLGLHGGGGSGEQFQIQTGLDAKADASNFIMVYPDGLTNPNANIRTWNAGKCCAQNASTLNTDDVGFISELIDKLASVYR